MPPPSEFAPDKEQAPERKNRLGDWLRIAEPEAALLFELDRFDIRERVPPYRRPIWGRAKAVIEGRQAWPRELLPWKFWRELRFHHSGRGSLPPWEDERNLTRPQRERRHTEANAWCREDRRRRDIAELLS